MKRWDHTERELQSDATDRHYANEQKIEEQKRVAGRDFGSSDCSTAIKHSKVDVRVIGDHPHSGKSGWIPLRNGEPETINMFGRLMAKIEFPDGTGCYAEMWHFSIYKDQSK